MHRTVLVIEDCLADFARCEAALVDCKAAAYAVVHAADGEQGLALIKSLRPYCVLLAASAPPDGGVAIMQRIHASYPLCPVIMLTGQGTEAIIDTPMKGRALNYLAKAALTPDLLHCAILSAIDKAALEGEIREQRQKIHEQNLALAATDRLNTAILDHASAMIVATERDGKIFIFNPAAETALGYGAEQVIGLHTPALWCDEGEIAAYAAELAISQGAKMKCGFEVLAYIPRLAGSGTREWTFVRKDASRFPATLSITPLHDAEGQIDGFLGMAEDITHRRGQALALKTSEETFRSAVENAPNGMALICPDGVLLEGNPSLCTMLGFDAAELAHMPIRSILHPDAVALGLDCLKTLADAYRVETRLLHKSGRIVHVVLSMSLINHPDGAPKYYVAQVLDVSERNEMDRIKSEFISIVSHELRTPLTCIRGSLGLLNGKIIKDVPPAAQRLIDIANKNCERLMLLINDILDIDKIASGTMRFEMKPESAALLLDEAVEAIRGYAGDRGVDVRLKRPSPDLMLNVDRDRFIQVLSNLLSNAVKFSPEDCPIELDTEMRNDYFRISVRDQGPGIPREFQDRVFNKFFQADGSSTREQGGTGLGLHISRQLIEHMGGRIGFDTLVGEGTTMWIELPPLLTLHTAMPTELCRRILVCEHDDRVAWLIQKMLTGEGFAADVVHSVPEARRQLKAVDYAAMTLDLGMPSGNGLDFARELRDDARTSLLPIVIVSGSERASWLQPGARSGIVDWVVKPINRERLIASVEKAAAANQLCH